MYHLSLSLLLLSLLLSLTGVQSLLEAAGLTVQTENGELMGTPFQLSYSGKQYTAFNGVPYAAPPTGANRFKEPQPLTEKWQGTRPALTIGSPCLQLDEFVREEIITPTNSSFYFNVHGAEDCLFLNVYVPAGGAKNKTVLFFIHGGAFMYGSGDQYGPNYVMDHDVIFVNFNYRLGPLGFITTGDDVIPGNSGLKDQVAALKWVRRNIANFGGDPNKISIVGASAGGASVDFMFLTNMTRGMFNRGYSMSGSSLTAWALVPNGVERTKILAEGVGCSTASSQEILDCLLALPAETVVDYMRNMFVFLYNPFTIFGPVVEVGSSNPYIDMHPRDILKQGLGQDLPWLAGVAAQDGLYPATEFVVRPLLFKQVTDDWTKNGVGIAFVNPLLGAEARSDTINDVRREYFGDKPIDSSTQGTLFQLLTDRVFAAGITEVASLRKGTHLYQYAYVGNTSFSQFMATDPPSANTLAILGTCHLDDASQTIFETFDISHTTPRDIAMAKVMMNILIPYVVNGTIPAEYDWPTAENGAHIRINSPDSIVRVDTPVVDFAKIHRLYRDPNV